jgi:hypothetical protein
MLGHVSSESSFHALHRLRLVPYSIRTSEFNLLEEIAFWDIASFSSVEVDQRSIVRMEAVCTLETLVYLHENARHNIPDGCCIQGRHRVNLKCNLTNLK